MSRVVLVSGGGTGIGRSIAEAFALDGEEVNVVAPGYIEDTEFFGRGLPTERRQALVDETTVKRAGTPEDVAATVRWLASPEARQVTGQIIQVNGGAERGR